MWKRKEKEIKLQFEERIVELVDTDSMDIRGSYENGVLRACDELCAKTKAKEDRGNTWWWNEQVKDAMDRKIQRLNLEHESISGK